MSVSTSAALLNDLRHATAIDPLDRKLLACSSMGEGRELLRAHALHGGSWVGWEVTTPRRLAVDLVGADLGAAGSDIADRFDEEAAIDDALDAAVTGAPPTLRELAETPGFRQAVAGTVAGLRLAGVSSERLAATSSSNADVRDLLVRVIDGYLRALRDARLSDTAALLERAVTALESDQPLPLDVARVWLVPGLSLRGVSGRLVRALLARGARVLRADPVEGPAPVGVLWAEAERPAPLTAVLSEGPRAREAGVELDLFAASGPVEELQEVLRRVLAAGLAWDDVEIVATDPVLYGGALHTLGARLGVPVSFAVGLPVERTRAGRAAAAYLQWIQAGYPAAIVRRLLENGDLGPPQRSSPPPMALARRLRRLRVGWGRERYARALDRSLRALEGDLDIRRHESEADARARVERERQQLLALRSLLTPILEAAPPLDGRGPARGDGGGGRVAPADVAAGLRAFLRFVPTADGPSATARERLLDITDRIAARLTRPTTAVSAIAVVRRHLEIRVPAPRQEGSSPWTSAGGHLHLADIDHGGLTGRAATFVVGLDAERFPRGGQQDPLLLDAQRRELAPEALPTAADRLAADRFRLAALFARLRGRVTLSYSAWDPAQAREVAPASAMLQAHRLRSGTATASFEDLLRELGDAASAIPAAGPADTTDVWLAALQRDGVLVDGVAAVTSAYPSLHRGLRAAAALKGDEATAHHGLVKPRPERFDPRRNPDIVLSATGLQDLGTCGLRYLYRYVLGLRKPEDPELDPDRWLDQRDRGRLLHSVYERALREARASGVAAGSPAFTEIGLRVLDDEAAAMRRDIPPPGAAVYAREMTELREDVRSFAGMMTGADDRWEDLELKFGFDGQPPAPLRLEGGVVHVRGAIDRVDREADRLVVVDYKTGQHKRYEARSGVFDGGRRLQNTVYTAVAESLLGVPVARMEYHFPTRRGQNEIIGYAGEAARRGLGLVDRLLDMVAGGRFLPTESGDDCRFCDYAPVCRHRVETRPPVTPLARWAAERFESLPEYRELRDVRRWEDRPDPVGGDP